jgi:hypothetical protein
MPVSNYSVKPIPVPGFCMFSKCFISGIYREVDKIN